MRISNEWQQWNGSLMTSKSINSAIGFSMFLVACLSLSTGCSSERSTSRLLEPTTARAQADALVHAAQVELALIRRDLAAARIATSKQEGETAELSRKATVLEADRAELRKMLEQAHSAVNALQLERDELKEALVQTQTVSVVRQDSNASTKLDGTDVQADMKELKARMVILTDALAQMKQRFSNKVRPTSVGTSRESSEHTAEASPERVVRDETTKPRIVPSALFLPPSEAAHRPGHASNLSPQQGLIQVQPGDSLWKLAHKHATTIDKLKWVNGLTTNMVYAGQRLILPSPMSINIAP
jgi:LysM repeat protein